MTVSKTIGARLGRKGMFITGAIGGASILGILLLSGSLASVIPHGATSIGPSQALTVGIGPTSLAGGSYYGFWVPCSDTGHCASNVTYHTAVVTMTMSTNTSNLTMFYFYGVAGGSVPSLSMAHGSLSFGTHTKTVTFSGYYAEFYNSHSSPITFTMSYVALFENNGS